MKIITYNVNGIRAAVKKGFIDWLKETDVDVVCIQETKAQDEQLPIEMLEEIGYHCYSFSAVKKGYSGVAIFSRVKPDHIEYGMGIEKYDHEGRMIRADYGDVSVLSIYHPSGSSGDVRQEFKMQWLADFENYVRELKKERPKLILCGDYNICHRPIDIHDPKRNANSSGFLPEEREWIDGFINSGYIDSFRLLNPEPHNYTWWSYRANARNNNKGWRIDYIMVSENMKSNIKASKILPEVKHSDHCPSLLEIDL